MTVEGAGKILIFTIFLKDVIKEGSLRSSSA